MSVATQLQNAFNTLLVAEGIPISIQNNTNTFTAGAYDDASAQTASGTLVTGSCVFQNLSQGTDANGDEKSYLEQGVINDADKKIFTPNNLEVNENAHIVLTGTTSNTGSWWAVKIFNNELNGTLVYKKIYIRPILRVV